MNASAKVSDNPHDLRKAYAALLYALGVARGQLQSVSFGTFKMDDVNRVYNATAIDHIAVSIGQTAESMPDIDWNDWLTEQEKLAIQGRADGE